MDMGFDKPRLVRWLISALVVVAIISAVLYIKNVSKIPKVKSVDPSNGAKNVSLGLPITVIFDKNISKKQAEQFFVINDIVNPKGVINVSANRLVFVSDPNLTLIPSSNYKIKIIPLSLSGRKGNEFESSFTTESANDNRLTPALKELLIEKTDTLEDGTDPNFSVIQFLPYEAADFAVDYEVLRNGTIVLNIQLKGSDNVFSKNKALEWIKSKGSDPGKFEVRYL
ncbi:MAG: hypothetical protein UT66_C0026G0020 [candidate division CPR2 bacterium GW2011_GWC1_39_9]|uniref:SbsA Ig-like domain-containing protein n=1 Tax=candidate division CPR2 bacterium GW2011_GWC2_39_10 TaxID=1618345 RepID=A0A0G0PA39_UNCC2|nr:MAG: hypothetical protein UT18_C0005G0019 [candidate division CPR2 bacterium GW2011_GWC2_39_10]KKR34268.1 MAG: hypothetical protein UT66_C0026G0020 [candidate division CPR2 bacterium GW2011_GWC1_39_9]